MKKDIKEPRILNWEWFRIRIHTMILELKDYRPDVVIGVSRGGLIPAVRLSHRLKIPLGIIHSRSYVGQTSSPVKVWGLTFPMTDGGWSQWENKKILIVDDILDSGSTKKEVLGYLKIYRFKKVKFITMITKRKGDKRWVTFPWEF